MPVWALLHTDARVFYCAKHTLRNAETHAEELGQNLWPDAMLENVLLLPGGSASGAVRAGETPGLAGASNGDASGRHTLCLEVHAVVAKQTRCNIWRIRTCTRTHASALTHLGARSKAHYRCCFCPQWHAHKCIVSNTALTTARLD